jgi:hypothetical protein
LAVRLPIRLDQGAVPTEELARLRAATELWHEHRLGEGGGWFICRSDYGHLDPQRWPALYAVADLVPADRLRVWISVLSAGATIRRHRDGTRQNTVRIHVPLCGQGILRIEEIEYSMEVGELWAVETIRSFHCAKNDGTVPRIHMLIDVHPNDWLREHVPWL